MTREQRKTVIFVPCAAWAGLALAVVFTALYAHIPRVPAKPAVTLAIAGAQMLASGLIFMRLDKSSALVRLTAAVGLAWLSFLFIFSFADYLTRPYPM